MYYIVETKKSFQQAAEDLDTAVKRHGFGVLHIHDLGATLRSKGIVFDEQCKIFEVCNPGASGKGFIRRHATQNGVALPYLGIYR